MSNPITKETFKDMDRGSQMSVLFDLQVETCDTVKSFVKETDRRLITLENKKPSKIDKLWAFAGGIVGGFAAIGAKLAIWRE